MLKTLSSIHDNSLIKSTQHKSVDFHKFLASSTHITGLGGDHYCDQALAMSDPNCPALESIGALSEHSSREPKHQKMTQVHLRS